MYLRAVVGALVVVATACASGPPQPRERVLPETSGIDRIVPVPAGTAATAPWPMAGHDARHSGSSPALGPLTGRIRWERQLEGNVTPGPAVAADGTIFAASNAGVLHALDPDTGADRWTYDGGEPYGSDLSTTPALTDDGVVLWPGPGATLYALDMKGALLWTQRLDAFVLSPVVLADGSVVVADMSGVVRRFDFAGGSHRASPTQRWAVALGGDAYGSPAAAGPYVYATAGADLVALVAETGAVSWRFTTGDLIEVSPAVTPAGVVVVASNDPYTYGVDADGDEQWRYERVAMSFSSPAVTDTDYVVAGDHRSGVDVIDGETGEKLARYQGLGDRTRTARSIGVWTAPVVDAAHRVYFGTRHGHVYGFAPDGDELFDIDVGATVDSYPALTADGALIVGVTDGRLLAIADDQPCTAARRTVDGPNLAYSPNRPDAVVGAVVDAPIVAIGVDDGPDPEWTPRILDVLARHGAHATFFVVGSAARDHPELLDEITRGGHEIGLHTDEHTDVAGRDPAEIRDDLERTAAAVRASGTEPVPLFRPPHGVQDVVAAEVVCAAGLRTVGWWANVNELSDSLLAALAPGSIVLAHDGRRDRSFDIAELDRLLAELDAKGERGVTVGELLVAAGVDPQPVSGRP
ncbi:MAG: PQQ-binding-like beta-propeller repeat protein [Actinomycetota bacterium]|nr:PQQ-binding-like beta-propeller repeat protein [Actinomycetota bacterium]